MMLSDPEKPPHCPWCHNPGDAILAHAAVRWGYRIKANTVSDDNAWEAHWYCAACDASFPQGVGNTIEEALTRSARRGAHYLAERRENIDKEIAEAVAKAKEQL
jgi:hypothetical protein